MKNPQIQSNGNLPAGIHLCTWQDIQEIFAFNARRSELLSGLKRASESLKLAGCRRIYIGGSFALQLIKSFLVILIFAGNRMVLIELI